MNCFIFLLRQRTSDLISLSLSNAVFDVRKNFAVAMVMDDSLSVYIKILIFL